MAWKLRWLAEELMELSTQVYTAPLLGKILELLISDKKKLRIFTNNTANHRKDFNFYHNHQINAQQKNMNEYWAGIKTSK